MLQAVSSCFGLFKSSWVNKALQVVFGRFGLSCCFNFLEIVARCFRMFLVVLGCFKLIQVVHVVFRLFQVEFRWVLDCCRLF